MRTSSDSHANRSHRGLRICAIAAGLLASGVALADAHLDPNLVAKLASTAGADELQIVVTYEQSGPVTAQQLQVLKSLGITKGITMRSLPIAGALATPAEIRALAQRDDVASIYFNKTLRYMNQDERRISGAARTVENPADYNRPIPFSGAGVTVLVNDSGIDGTHDDLKFGTHVVQNTTGLTNLAAFDTMLPITYTEGVPNTDISSGHGTHCAGTIAGTGARSNGKHRGVAAGADLVGYGSGAVISILDAVGGLDYAATNQFSYRNAIRVTSNSWGSSGKFDPLDPVSIATYELYKRGIVSVFAAGNDGPGEDTHNPYAQAPWVISVGAGENDGVLTSFSSRGKRGETGTFTMPDGRSWTYYNEPTIVAPGVDVISTRTLTGALPPLEAQHDADTLPLAELPFYTHMSGTSMATPHVAGIVALMLEANPHLTPAQVKDIVERTATNMTGRLSWEAGAGHINAYAAVAESSAVRYGWGSTVNFLREFNANALLAPGGASFPWSVDFAPVGTVQSVPFEVGANVAWVTASASTTSTVAVVLIDPDGNQYGSSIGIPAPIVGNDGEITTGAPGKAGTWYVTVRGIGSVSGTGLDPLKVTNGYAAPGTVTGTIAFLNSGGYTGMGDVANHPARQAIEFAVANRLVDGYSDKSFRPDAVIKRSELAQYLTMGQNVRQSLPFNNKSSFTDLAPGDARYAFAESAVARGGALRDLTQGQDGIMGTVNGAFRPNDSVTRVSLAYSLVQSMALQESARAFTGPLTVFHEGKRIAIDDAGSIAPALRGYVQQALDLGLINARFTVTQGPYDLTPVLHAWFDPNKTVTRAAFAVSAGRYLTAYQSSQD
ncbi:Peptidase S8/S53 subtilisin kexin sedolisin [Lysobacter dokdonensis DS-58]|uniref:Peptidase S8/S53 subtilisin kexin sedolisin n=1 Tax=Lysobacter dokdonensis DS-58 TaxID=1300345 RepID=A0A0A2WEE6_9GAMM|nr:S8 family serine peptidase [Lysobacter dokdonensis]KGQ18581.1 Peptidase S8/S53 subtilisin kexin sedolisin [Lysobacter dokdonensis DS-58]